MVTAAHGDVRCCQLEIASLGPWLHLISPLLREYVSKVAPGSEQSSEDQDATFVAFGIERVGSESEGAQPIGLLLAQRIDSHWQGDASASGVLILSVAIQRSYRRQGFGRMLLKQVEDWARSNAFTVLRCPVPVPSSHATPLLKLTASDLGWTTTPGKVVVSLSIGSAVEHLLARLERAAAYQARHATWEIAPFPEQHTPSLQRRIQMAAEGELAAPWDPDDDDIQWVPAVNHSRLLLENGRIIGWLITHFVSQDCLRYAKFWVDPGWEKSGAPLALLADVMRSAHFNGQDTVIPKGCLISHPTNPLLHHWIRKQFKPVCDRWVEIENHDLDLTRA